MKLSRLSAVSAFARPEEHLTRKTLHGAVVTMLGVILATTLFIHELSWFLSSKGNTKMEVDLQRRHDLDIHVDITFHSVPCAALSVDIIDASGTSDSDVNFARGAHLHKVRLDATGRRVSRAGEYETPQSQRLVQEGGATVMNVDLGAALQQMGDMEEEMGAHEGCRLFGDITVRRVAGRLHFAVHQQSFIDMLPQMLTGHVLPRVRNMSHTVHKVAFGPSFPGQVNPLDGTQRVEAANSGGHAYKYYIKVVPTDYTTRFGSLLETSQYSVTEYAMPLLAPGQGGHGKRDPFVDFVYDLSPIVMRIHQSPLGLLHFVVRLCAVVGGALSITRLCDGLVHGTVKALGLTESERRSSTGTGGGRAGTGGGGGHMSYSGSGGLLPTRSGSHHGSLQANNSVQSGLGTSLLRHSSNGSMSGGGAPAPPGSSSFSGAGGLSYSGGGAGGGGGGGTPRHSVGMPMSPLSGVAAPQLGGFGSCPQVDGQPQQRKHG